MDNVDSIDTINIIPIQKIEENITGINTLKINKYLDNYFTEKFCNKYFECNRYLEIN
jgi:hypothetical protein